MFLFQIYVKVRLFLLSMGFTNLRDIVERKSIVLSTEQERDLFLQNFQKYLMSGSPKQSVDQPNDFKATKVCINLGNVALIFLVIFWLNVLNYVASNLFYGFCRIFV